VFRRVGLLLLAALLAGCAGVQTENPQFNASRSQLADLRAHMRANPSALARPVVVIGGYRSPFWAQSHIGNRLREYTGSNEILVVQTFAYSDLESAARGVIRAIERRWPSDDDSATIEVDVVGLSMGGVVGRLITLEDPRRKRADVARVFSIASPHRGAKLAERFRVDPASRQMAPGSDLLARLDSAPGPQIIPYAVLADGIVGEENTTPPGMQPIWTGGAWLRSHSTVYRNEKILVDIALRLRGEPPLGLPAPLPGE